MWTLRILIDHCDRTAVARLREELKFCLSPLLAVKDVRPTLSESCSKCSGARIHKAMEARHLASRCRLKLRSKLHFLFSLSVLAAERLGVECIRRAQHKVRHYCLYSVFSRGLLDPRNLRFILFSNPKYPRTVANSRLWSFPTPRTTPVVVVDPDELHFERTISTDGYPGQYPAGPEHSSGRSRNTDARKVRGCPLSRVRRPVCQVGIAQPYPKTCETGSHHSLCERPKQKVGSLVGRMEGRLQGRHA